MEASLLQATKLHSIPKLLDRLNAFGSPPSKTTVYPINGEGSSFLAIPVKHHTPPSPNLASKSGTQLEEALDQCVFDFKAYLLPYLLSGPVSSGLNSPRRGSGASDAYYTGMSSNMELDAATQEHSWHALNQLRVHAGAPERSEQGIQKLMHYYAQLCWLEDCFPFATGKVQAVFSWYESFFPKKQVATSSIQYEKAAVMWNIGALYSQLGSLQSLWTPEGLKRASKYFQKAAGTFVYVRDTLGAQLHLQLDHSSDLSDFTLTAVSDLMLAQAAECFVFKAEYDNTSSAVTSQIAAQASDFYDVAYKSAKQGNSVGKYRFPKPWCTHLHVKHLIHASLAHLHSPNYLEADTVVGERQARLLLAKELAECALEKCALKDQSAAPELRVLASHLLQKIQRVLDEVEKANYEKYHQTVVNRDLLKPLKRPPNALVYRIDVVRGVGCGSVWDGIRQGKLRFILEDLLGQPQINGIPSRAASVSQSPMHMILSPDYMDRMANVETNFNVQSHHPSEIGKKRMAASLDSLQTHEMEHRAQTKTPGGRNTSLVPISLPVVDEVRRFSVETNQTLGHWLNILRQLCQAMKTIEEELEHQSVASPISTDIDIDPSKKQVYAEAQALLKRYQACEQLHLQKPTLEIYDQLTSNVDEIGSLLCEASTNLQSSSIQQEKSDNMFHWASLQQAIGLVAREWSADPSTYSSLEQIELDDECKSIIESCRHLRTKSIELITIMEENTFGELFVYETSKPGSDLHWSANKIKTILPCMDEHFVADRTKIQQSVTFLLEKFKKTTRFNEESLSGSFNALVAEIARIPFQFRAQRGEMTKLLNAIENELQLWLVDNEDYGSAVEDNKKLWDRLAAIGRSEAPADGFGLVQGPVVVDAMAMKENFIRLGIEKAKSNIRQLMKEACETNARFKPLVELFESEGVPAVLNLTKHLAEKIEHITQVDADSEKIIYVFEEQLTKWFNWRSECIHEIQAAQSIQEWLHTNFEGLHSKPKTRRTSSLKDIFASTEKMNQFITENEQLERRQEKNATKVADMATQLCSTQDDIKLEMRQKAPIVNVDQSRSPKNKRRDMLRRLSITAAAIEKQAKTIEEQSTVLRQSNSKEELVRQHEELSRQLLVLKNQQRDFVKQFGYVGVYHPQTQKRASVGGLVRTTKALQSAKTKFMSIMRRASDTLVGLKSSKSNDSVSTDIAPAFQANPVESAIEPTAPVMDFCNKADPAPRAENSPTQYKVKTNYSMPPVFQGELPSAQRNKSNVSDRRSHRRISTSRKPVRKYAEQCTPIANETYVEEQNDCSPSSNLETYLRAKSSLANKDAEVSHSAVMKVGVKTPRKLSFADDMDKKYFNPSPSNITAATMESAPRDDPHHLDHWNEGTVVTRRSSASKGWPEAEKFSRNQYMERRLLNHAATPLGIREGMDRISQYMAWNRGVEGDDIDYQEGFPRRKSSLGTCPYIP